MEGFFLLYQPLDTGEKRMAFYDLGKEERRAKISQINAEIETALLKNETGLLLRYFSESDTHIRKRAYLAVAAAWDGKQKQKLKHSVLRLLSECLSCSDEKIRQTAVYAAGEIGRMDFSSVEKLLEQALFDSHHSVKNAVIGSLKRIGQKAPSDMIAFSGKYLEHPDPEVRRQVIHGVELRGRTHPQDVLPLLGRMQNERESRVRKMVIHVAGEISYKEGCLETVLTDLRKWENRQIASKILEQILNVHRNYQKFTALPFDIAEKMIRKEMRD